jgi:hypothetical protein
VRWFAKRLAALPLAFRFLSVAVFAAICKRTVFATVLLTGFAVSMTATGIGAFTGLVYLFGHILT